MERCDLERSLIGEEENRPKVNVGTSLLRNVFIVNPFISTIFYILIYPKCARAFQYKSPAACESNAFNGRLFYSTGDKKLQSSIKLSRQPGRRRTYLPAYPIIPMLYRLVIIITAGFARVTAGPRSQSPRSTSATRVTRSPIRRRDVNPVIPRSVSRLARDAELVSCTPGHDLHAKLHANERPFTGPRRKTRDARRRRRRFRTAWKKDAPRAPGSA